MKKRVQLFLLVVFASLFLPSVTAIGISPPTSYVDFEPFGEGTVRVSIINTGSSPIRTTFDVRGVYAHSSHRRKEKAGKNYKKKQLHPLFHRE